MGGLLPYTHKRLQNYKKRIIYHLFQLVFYLQISIFLYKADCTLAI